MYRVSFVASPNKVSLLTSKVLRPSLFFSDPFQSLLSSKRSKVDYIHYLCSVFPPMPLTTQFYVLKCKSNHLTPLFKILLFICIYNSHLPNTYNACEVDTFYGLTFLVLPWRSFFISLNSTTPDSSSP